MSLENMMEPTGEITPEKYSAIEHSVRIGSLLVIEHPEIAELYRNGMTHSGIAESLDVKREYSIPSDDVARNSIRYAITGHAGGFSTEPYDGLIQNLDELAELEHEHYAENGRKLAESINPETGERYAVEAGRKSNEAQGNKLWEKEETEYAHLLSLEPKYKRGSQVNNKEIAQVLNEDYHNWEEVRSPGAVKKNLSRHIYGRIGALAQGKTLWEKEETEYAHLLSLEPEFQHQKGKHKGKGDYKTIAQVLNVDYHNGEEVRSAGCSS